MREKKIDKFSWDNISIDKYYQMMDILNDEEDDDITKNVKLVAVVTDRPEEEIWNMDLTQAGDYISKLIFLNKFDIPKNPDIKIKLPNYKLRVIKDLSKINMAQYVDYQNFATLPFREGIDKILSIFLIPEGYKYNTDYDILDLQKEIRQNLSFRVAEGLLGFFLRKYGELLIDSLASCKKMMKKMKDKEKREQMEMKIKELTNQFKNLTSLIGSCSSTGLRRGQR